MMLCHPTETANASTVYASTVYTVWGRVGGMSRRRLNSPQPVRLMVVILDSDQNRNYVQDAEVLPPPPLRRPGTFRRSLKNAV
jgi:hypothetical protein